MRSIPLTLAGFAALGAVAFAIGAQAQMDADGDGVFSYDELVAVYPDLSEEAYTTIDTDADGIVSADELSAAVEAGTLPTQG